ncbi:beta-xylosidase [Aspergillus fischeri NRRL 181]|uniref:Glycosyl hydrolase family 43 protein n=1 Tax=Neosartorya fischeri (strain ATCC 1020 / DSM 3700 / CBS 544.65 / FGSC A1164 / JCM 1740 / NRRL 181 / WB 181) TaxID=331117 RepID=A1D5D2_NEOFI|nr:glycosyl hydrolase family 43 protein [Aspergillus fischeri NRRL 181]EAW23625.1 glycosyl hydrolase family 43 protein [Aspergillus fischeri NRRL 181]
MRRFTLSLLVIQSWVLTTLAIRNPIISGWNPDPSILSVGDEYFLATSSFEYWPSTPIYKSKNLANWELFSHAFTRPEQLQLYGTPTGAGAWAPTLSYINGKYYLAAMTRWTYDPVARVWPRVMWVSSHDLKSVYLNLMSPNNNKDRIWGIYQCEVDVDSGRCIGEYRSMWNGTLPHNASARPEGPKMFKRDKWYYLLIAEGGTDDLHRASIARSLSPEGPWDPAPHNPILFNGAYGYDNLTVQSTGHATIFEAANGDSYAVYLARRKINGSSPLGRETFMSPVTWKDGWPMINGGNPVLLSESFGPAPDQKLPPSRFIDAFNQKMLDPSWYTLRTPYAPICDLEDSGRKKSHGIVFRPNVFGLSDRDTPAAILRKQKSLNMTFSAQLLPTTSGLGYGETVGISAYLSELQHQDIGVSGCVNSTGMCIFTQLMMNGTIEYNQVKLNSSSIPSDLTLRIRAEPLSYTLGYSFESDETITWLASLSSSWLAFAPSGWFVFEGASFALFATGTGQPWPPHAPEVGFSQVTETYYDEDIPDYDRWSV